jgi:hypothetical protein
MSVSMSVPAIWLTAGLCKRQGDDEDKRVVVMVQRPRAS